MLGACGRDAALATASATPTAAGSGPAAMANAEMSTGGAAGPAANGGSSASAGAAAVVMCGSASCTAPAALPAVSPVTPMACCVDAASSQCGYVVSGVCTPPAPDAPKCPAVMIALGKSCCVTSSNVCGIDSTAFGMGCRDIFPGAKTMCDGTRAATGAAAGNTAANGGGSGTNAAAAGSGTAGSSAAANGGSGAQASGRSGSTAGAGGR